tara:strand:- start:210 stop:485 length:276 start_codon:yes stop_codon:yes gene_type:complete
MEQVYLNKIKLGKIIRMVASVTDTEEILTQSVKILGNEDLLQQNGKKKRKFKVATINSMVKSINNLSVIISKSCLASDYKRMKHLLSKSIN